jgi:hypothetical protein
VLVLGPLQVDPAQGLDGITHDNPPTGVRRRSGVCAFGCASGAAEHLPAGPRRGVRHRDRVPDHAEREGTQRRAGRYRLIPLAAFAVAVQRRIRSWWLLLPLAFASWALVHASGVHATVAGVVLGFTVPVLRRQVVGGSDAGPGLAEHFEHRFRPLSAAVAVPVFAFFAAGVTVGGLTGLQSAVMDPVTVGVIAGLVIGKPVGVLGAAWLVARLTGAELDADLAWVDVLGLALLSGIGFTVSLLIGELAFGAGSDRDDPVKIAVLTGSLLSAALASIVLRIRDGVHRPINQTAATDAVDRPGGGGATMTTRRGEGPVSGIRDPAYGFRQWAVRFAGLARTLGRGRTTRSGIDGDV